MKYKTMSYYSYGSERLPGVMKKINNTVQAARNIGIKSEHKAYKSSEKFQSIKDFLHEDAELIFVRFSFFIHTFLFPVILLKRLQGKKIIVDVPTPRAININEMRGNKVKNLRWKILWNYIFGSWLLWPVHVIIQYAEESSYFSFGLRHKTLKIGNGILIDNSIKLVESIKHTNQLNLIAVASLAFWHGYDRLLKAIAMINEKSEDVQIYLTIVGDGEILENLKKLSQDLTIAEQVRFTGALYGDDLDQIYTGMNVGVASLGLFRIGLNEASVLKTREYMAKGLCVLGAGKDPDFTENSPYRFLVPNDESIEPLTDMLIKLAKSDLPKAKKVRKYAEENLAFEGKLKTILDKVAR